jgi:5-methylcytosine-specific restriction enzyme subunit McrC
MERVDIKHFLINEQDTFSAENQDKLQRLHLDFRKDEKEIRFLGLNPISYSVSYYIGIDWLRNNESYIIVHPKIKNLDYVRMFVYCLHHSEISKFLKEVYHIDFQKPQIETPAADWDLAPFLVVHFLSLVEKIVKQGLKKNYIVYEENLNSKIKGKIVFSQHVKKNIAAKREERIFCRYQEYSTDCFENRLLKKTLLFVQRYTARHLDRVKYETLFQKQNRLLAVFENVSENISYSEIKRIKISALYKEYVEAIDLAKKILRYFGHSFKKAESVTEKRLPPFWIDMAKLFELYVYSLLKEEFGTAIKFQERGKYGNVDFLKIDEKLIIDTKYKSCYSENKYNIDDIRQLSGYARDKGILKKLNIVESQVVDCIVIYPDSNAGNDFRGRKLMEDEIKGFVQFYKNGIGLPRKM